MKEKYILYLIIDKSGKLLKIGKTKESFKHHRYKKIENDFNGAQFDKSLYIESLKKEEIDNLERILHKVFYKERKQDFFKTGVGKTEWFNIKILEDVKKHIIYLKKNNPNFSYLSEIKEHILYKSTYKKFYKQRFFFFIFFFFIGFLIGTNIKNEHYINKIEKIDFNQLKAVLK